MISFLLSFFFFFLLGRPWLILVRYVVAWLGDEGLESVVWLEMEQE